MLGELRNFLESSAILPWDICSALGRFVVVYPNGDPIHWIVHLSRTPVRSKTLKLARAALWDQAVGCRAGRDAATGAWLAI